MDSLSVTANARAMRNAVLDLIDRLPDDAASRMLHDFDDPARIDWAYYPKDSVGSSFHGVALADVSPVLQRDIHRVVETGLSTHAFGRAAVIRALEPVLDAREGHRDVPARDSLRYHLAVFGQPDVSGSWAWRFEGHHLSIGHTVVDDHVIASTPLFFGSNPAEIRRGDTPLIRPCGEEEDAGRTLITALDAEQRSIAMLGDEPPIDVILADAPFVPPVARPGDPPHPIQRIQREFEALDQQTKDRLSIDLAAPKGIPYSALTRGQQTVFDELVDVYVDRLPELLAAEERDRIDEARERLHFAWAGATQRRGAHYYRIQGPELLVEYDCVQNDADHIHAVWRNPVRDFGGDILRLHHSTNHR